MDDKNKPIGFFDSGIGGISVLRETIKLLPNENYIYYGDSKNAPYGVKTPEQIKNLSINVANILIDKGVKAIVVACNTATAAAIETLRTQFKDIPVIGIEPAIKPAVSVNSGGKVVVMATPMTLAQNKFKTLIKNYDENYDIFPMPCGGLMEFVERGELDTDELKSYLKEKFSELNINEIDSIVLGCTHYPFIKDALKEIVGQNIELLDGGIGTSKQLKHKLKEKNLLNDSIYKGHIEILNSNDCENTIKLSKWLLNQ